MNDTYLKTCFYDPNDEDNRFCPKFRIGQIIDVLDGNYTSVASQVSTSHSSLTQ